jgi:hypothetical protein
MWDVKEGEQIEDVVPNVSAPRWGRLWWFSYESGLMFLPSQYWHGKGDASDLYGISCGPDDQPSYHSAFYSAIPETELPTSQPCSTPPRLITPVDGAAVHSLSPHFEVDFSNEPHAVIFRINYSTIDSGTEGSSRVFVDFFTPLERLNFPIPYNLDPTVTYRWYATYVCSDGSEMSSEEWTFTTEIL